MALKLNSVLITDDVDPKCIDILKRNGVEVVFNPKLAKDKEALLAELPRHDGLIVRSATKVTADVINASNLSIIGRAGTGTDNIDSVAATNKGVIVMNTPGGNTISAAELTCAMICGLSRNIGTACISMKEGRWDRKLFMGSELQGKTLAVVGLGRIGREVASRMRSFGMKTIGYDPLVSAEESAAFDVTSYPLKELWPLADYITVHVPLIPPTKNLINGSVFSKCKKGVKVINCARGGIIDEVELLEALNSGQCGGAGLDVFVQEPPKDQSLVQHPNVLATPHLGASTTEAQSRVAEEIAQQFIDARDGKSLFGALNAKALVNAMDPVQQPMIELGRCMGVMASCVVSAPSKLLVKASGDAGMKTALSFLPAAVGIGLMKNSALNLINAPALAKAAGYELCTEYVAGGDNSVSLVQDGVNLFTGCVEGKCSVLTQLAGVPLHNAMTLVSGSSYIMFTTSTKQAKDEALITLLGSLGSQGVAVSSLVTGSSETNGACLVQLSSAPLNTEALAAAGIQVCKHFVL